MRVLLLTFCPYSVLMITSSSNCFSIEVFDDDLGKDKSLGKVELDINLLKAVKNQWFPLQEYMLITLTLNRNLVDVVVFYSLENN